MKAIPGIKFRQMSVLLILMALSLTAAACDTGTPPGAGSAPTALPTDVPVAALTTSSSTPLPGDQVNAIKGVIQQANQEEVQAFAYKDPSVMADTGTTTYYKQMVQGYRDMVNSGVTAIQLIDLKWGTITAQDATTAQGTTAQAITTETWGTTFSDGSTVQESDANVYTLVMQDSAWKIEDDQHPSTRTLQPQPDTGSTAGATPGVGTPTPITGDPSGTDVEQSSNWAGYAAGNGTFTAIFGSWTVPNVTLGGGSTISSDATWVGIGGVNTTDLIQAGTETDVQDGQIEYSAWWETLPQASQPIALDVSAGDSVSVSITQQAGGTWQITIRNATSGQSFQKNLAYQSSLSSAEWVEETPTVGRRTLLPLDDFGTITFTNATTTENGQQHTIAQAGGQPITMYNSSILSRLGRLTGLGSQADQVIAQPSALGTDGSSFSVTRTNP